jgi:uncharacterized protein (DUF1697 family)
VNRLLVLLRAVNVGGTAKLSMDELRLALTDAGYQNVKTYIASGNIIFDTDDNTEAVRLQVNSILNNQFNINGERSIVREITDIKRIIKTVPFRDAAQQRPNLLHVHFLSSHLHQSAETNLTSYKGVERLRLDGQHLYIDYVNDVGHSALTGRFLETALGSSGSSRNWNTILKLAEMLEQD